MRILHLISQRPDSTGSGIYIKEMLTASSHSTHKNHLLAGVQAGEFPSFKQLVRQQCTFVEFGSASLPLKIVGMSDVMPYPSARFRDLTPEDIARYENGFASQISHVVSTFKPHIIHSHHLWLLSSLTARMYPNIPLVTTCHGSDLRQFRNCPHLQPRVLSGCKHIQAIMALSDAQKQEISDLYALPAEKISVVGGGYNSRMFFQEKKPQPYPVRLLYAGKLSKAKGVPWLLQALNDIGQNTYHLDLVGGGSGNEYNHCLHLAAKLGDAVTVHGAVPQAELAALMRKAHIMVLPSLFEGLPLIMLEALAAGCRVIVSELPGTLEIASVLRTNYIKLVPLPRLENVDQILTEDEELFSHNLLEAISEFVQTTQQNPDLDLTPLEQRMHHFGWEEVFTRTQAVYAKALSATS